MENKYIKRAKKVLGKNKHYEFFKTNLYNFNTINNYKGFEHLDSFFDKEFYDSSHEAHYSLTYSCWFVVVCVLANFGDDWTEFENDREGFINDYEYIKKYNLSKVFCELKEFFLAYKVLCKNTEGTRIKWYENVPKNLKF